MPNTLSLYDLDAALAEIEAAIIDADGEISDDQDARLGELLDAREDKVDRYIALIRRSEATASAFQEEARRLASHASAHANTAKRLKERLHGSMVERGETELVGRLGKARVQRAGTRAVVLRDADVDELPERFRRVVVSADTRALAEALKAGDEEAERCAFLDEPTTYVRIY